MSVSTAVSPFTIAIPDADLEDLRERLRRTRWPERELVSDWTQGIPLQYTRELCRYWAEEHDWRRVEARLNALDQGRTELDGLNIHFVHARSPVEDALPLIITHGWPGSVVEFLDIIGPLTDPAAHGGDAADAFHVVCPSLPGFGFSDRPAETGWKLDRIAAAWTELMGRLGYERFGAQGGDWGAFVTMALGRAAADRLVGIHLNLAIADAEQLIALGDLTEYEQASLAAMQYYLDWENGYSQQQSTRPQTLGYGLADSPAGQCAWIAEKFYPWTDCDGHPENAVARDTLLDNISVYWLTNTAASSGRMYWENYKSIFTDFSEVAVPSAYSVFPKDVFTLSERWARTRYTDLRYYNQLDKGGHFASLERPETFVEEVRAGFRAMR